jgi:hypothetical protein
MLDAFIIEEIKRNDREVVRDDRPAVELPLPPSEPSRSEEDVPPEPPDRGVIIIDYTSGA